MRFNKLRFLQNFFIYSASITITAVWMYATFVAYQNKMLRDYQKQYAGQQKILSTPTPTENNEVPTSDKSKNWQTYRNSQFSYEVKYPTDWKIDKSIKDSTSFYSPDSVYPNSYLIIEFVDANNSCDKNTDTRFKQAWQEYNDMWLYDYVDNKVAYLYKGTFHFNDGKNYEREYRLLSDNNSCYSIDSYSLNANYSEIHDQILSTFKFTN